MLSSIRRGFGGQAGATPPRKIAVRVRGGYDPETIRAEAGAPLPIVFRREESAPCSEQVAFPTFVKGSVRSPTRPPRPGVTLCRGPTATVLMVSGALDTYTVASFRDAAERCDMARAHLIVNLSEATLVDSSGLRALLMLRDRAERAGRSIGIVHANSDLTGIFVIVGLTTGVVVGATEDRVAASLDNGCPVPARSLRAAAPGRQSNTLSPLTRVQRDTTGTAATTPTPAGTSTGEVAFK